MNAIPDVHHCPTCGQPLVQVQFLSTELGLVPTHALKPAGGKRMTERQQQILRLMIAGHRNEDIARILGITIGTTKIHITAIFKTLGVRNRTQARTFGAKLDLAPLPVDDGSKK